jgi:hypothetical protein
VDKEWKRLVVTLEDDLRACGGSQEEFRARLDGRKAARTITQAEQAALNDK